MAAKEDKKIWLNKKEQQRLTEALELLGEWFCENGRSLPWRVDTEAYHVWVSEIMLQQTRIEAARSYYQRFMEAFPDVKTLAECSEERLMKYWEGLGYYSRARNLLKCAKTVVDKYEGHFPEEKKELASLPGIGPYTAGAISSICFHKKAAAVDGNVLRVLTRFFGKKDDISDARVAKNVAAMIENAMKTTSFPPGEINQGLMELGELVCIPNGMPICENCPLREVGCTACRDGNPLDYPVKALPKERKKEEYTVFICEGDEYIWLKKRPEEGLLSSMYELPNCPGILGEEEALGMFGGEINAHIVQQYRKKHIFSHIEWDMNVYRIALPADYVMEGAQKVTKEQLREEISLPVAFSKCLKK